jgi:type IV fimbrial biogenesis protein FimT
MAKESGLTLVELLVTIVVLSVLLALGVPGLQNFVKNNRLTAQANDLVVALQLARSEAVKRGTGSVVCASANEATCSNSDDWTTGWIVFTDIGQDFELNLDANGDLVEDCINDDCIIRTRGALNKTTLDGGGNDSISFLPNGLVRKDPGNDITLTLTSDNCKLDQVRVISITNRGRTFVKSQDCP